MNVVITWTNEIRLFLEVEQRHDTNQLLISLKSKKWEQKWIEIIARSDSISP